jgi:3-hydroxyacyl-CoA dehydrogenase
VCDGFIGNRMIEQYSRQAGFLLEEGCTPEQVDKAIEKFGFAMGPFRMGDLAGNDIGWASASGATSKARPALQQDRRPAVRDGPLRPEDRRRLVRLRAGASATASRRRGRRDDRASTAPSSASRRARSATTRSCTGWCSRSSTKAAKILEEGIASKASDIDMVYLTGYGFPLHRGGPMCYADTVGLFNVVQADEALRAQPARRRRLLAAGAAAGAAGGRRQDLQSLRRGLRSPA